MPNHLAAWGRSGRHEQRRRQRKIHDEGVEFVDMMVVDRAHSSGEKAESHDEENGRQCHQDHMGHQGESASNASTNRLMARRSADPPGLRRRATNDRCTILAPSPPPDAAYHPPFTKT